MEKYIVRLRDGTGSNPMTIGEVEAAIKNGTINTTSIMTIQGEREGNWHFAASIEHVRELLRKYRPAEASIINRIQITDQSGRPVTNPKKKSGNQKKGSKSLKPGSKSKSGAEERYLIRGGDGIEYGPMELDEVKELIKKKHLKAMSMVHIQSTNHWYLAASVPEIRLLLRKHAPEQSSVLNRLRAIRGNHLRESVFLKLQEKEKNLKRPFWKKLFSATSDDE